MKRIIASPDDMHCHFREGNMLKLVLPYTSKVFARGVAMGNLPNPIVTADDAERYREEILKVDSKFSPIMTVMLTKRTTPPIIEEAFKRGFKVLKYIPGNASTNSEQGVSLVDLENYYSVLETAQRLGMIFSGHWEASSDISGMSVPEINRATEAIPFLKQVVNIFPNLKVIVEHVSTDKMIEYVKKASDNVGATLTIHHALLTYGEVCNSGMEIYNPNYYCKPIAKKVSDKHAVIAAMMSGNPKFFFGSDSAPHPLSAKVKYPPSAGIFTAPVVLPLLCELFENYAKFSRLEDFVSRFGAQFYGLPLNEGKVVLKKESWAVPVYAGDVSIFRGGRRISWQIDN